MTAGSTVTRVPVGSQVRRTRVAGWTSSDAATLVWSIGPLNASSTGASSSWPAAIVVVNAAWLSGTIAGSGFVAVVPGGLIRPERAQRHESADSHREADPRGRRSAQQDRDVEHREDGHGKQQRPRAFAIDSLLARFAGGRHSIVGLSGRSGLIPGPAAD